MSTVTAMPHVGRSDLPVYRSIVDGRSVEESDQTVALVDPSTGARWAGAVNASAGVVDAAVAAAARAYEAGVWRDLDPQERARILGRFATLIEESADEMGRLEVLSCGKTLRTTRREVAGSAGHYRFFAGAYLAQTHAAVDLGRTAEALIRHEPLGVVVAITPFNGTISLGTWKLAPALAAGNTVVLKPPLETPAASVMMGELALEAGIPPGVLNVVPGDGEVGRRLATHPHVAMVTFTGSTGVAKRLAAEVGGGLKRFACEAGGKSAQIVFADADLDSAVLSARQNVFSNTGQSCVAASRLLVQRSIYDSFVQRLVDSTRQLRVGNPFDEATHIGPLASAKQFARVSGFVERALAAGATCLAGGTRPDLPDAFAGGFYYLPTVLSDVTRDMEIWQEEVFGPVVVVVPFDDEDEAVLLANDSRYGLAAGLWTTDLRRAHRVSRRLQAGTVWINTFRVMNLRVPFGGYKDSGLGRENGIEALREFQQLRSIVTEHAPIADAFAF